MFKFHLQKINQFTRKRGLAQLRPIADILEMLPFRMFLKTKDLPNRKRKQI